MDLAKIDRILTHVFNMAGKSELQAIDYASKEFVDGSTIKALNVGDYKALRHQIIEVARYKSILLFHYEGATAASAVFVCGAQIPEVLLYIRDKDPKYINMIAKQLEMSTPGVYKLIDRVEQIYTFKLNTILDQTDIHILLGLKIKK